MFEIEHIEECEFCGEEACQMRILYQEKIYNIYYCDLNSFIELPEEIQEELSIK